MSSRGATHKGAYHPTKRQKSRSRVGQRDRKKDDAMHDGSLAGIPSWQFKQMVAACRGKVAHRTKGAAHYAKVETERERGVKLHIYECPICGCFHTTSHDTWYGRKYED